MAQVLCIWIFACLVQYELLQVVQTAGNINMSPTAPTYIDMNRFRSELLYPHEREFLVDTINRDQDMREMLLTFRLPFFGFNFRYVWIHRDGYIIFNKGLLEYNLPLKFPTSHIKDPTLEEDPSLIAPWFSQQVIPNTVEGAGVYYQLVDLGNEKNDSLKERLQLDFKDGMVGSGDFIPTHALIITWKNMTHANSMSGFALKTNSYQAVIATDEKRTYVMFNYDDINWITASADGLKGNPAFIGFNAGNQTRAFEFLPYSQQPRVSSLPSLGFGNGLRGRFFFQVDEEIWPGCCIDRYLDIHWPTRPKLTLFPRYGSMLGGTVVNVTGPCLENPHSIIRCKFDTIEVDGIYRTPNHVSCISPPVMYHGYVDLSLSIDHGPFLFFGKYYVQPPDMVEPDVDILDGSDKLEAPKRFMIHWKHEKLTWDAGALVTITLWGFRETKSNYPSLTYIDTLTEQGTLNGNGQYSVDLEELKTRWNPDKLDIHFGFIAINLTDPEALGYGSTDSPVLWSGPLPLGWYFGSQWKRQLGKNWKAKICEDWYTREKHSDRFVSTLVRCPCTLEQAKLDTGRFIPDIQCNEIGRKCETFHQAAYHCVRSSRPAVSGADQLCCYDDSGELIRTGDTIYGGRPDRASLFGKHPFRKERMIPVISHWFHDVSPFFFCCKWTEGEENSETCEMYKYWRTSQDCSLYQPPMIASVYGDPHFLTFDHVNYTFNGKGEFVLTRVDHIVHKLDVQGRFEQPIPIYSITPEIKGTRLMAVAARDNVSSIVEFRVRPPVARWRYQMYILVDQEYVYFENSSPTIQFFKGVTLYQPINVNNVSHIVAMFDSGAGVEVMIDNGHMAVHVYLPTTFMNKTRGLLGNWSRIPEDDFTLPNGEVSVLPEAKIYDIHHKFGMHYRVTEVMDNYVGRSLFYHNSIPFSQYDNKSFVPEWEKDPPYPPNVPYSEREVDYTCGTLTACRFDFIVTGDKELAVATRNHEIYARKKALAVRHEIIRCPEIAKPRHGLKSGIQYIVGTTVNLTCEDGYRIAGDESRSCKPTGLWSWDEDTECISESDFHLKKAAISFAIIAPTLFLGALLCVFFLQFSRYRKFLKEKVLRQSDSHELPPNYDNGNSVVDESHKNSDFSKSFYENDLNSVPT